jgi:hypothetical protein
MPTSGNVTPTPDPSVPQGSTVKVTVRPTVEPDLINFKVSNPVTYLRLWWKKVIANEGINIKIKPLTAIIITVIAVGGVYGGGYLTAMNVLRKVPVVNQFIPPITPTPNPLRNAGFAGILRKSGDKFFLQTGDGQAINLIIPANVNLNSFIGKRIFATGSFNTIAGYLTVQDATDLEVLPASPIPVPTSSPSPTPEPTIIPSPTG